MRVVSYNIRSCLEQGSSAIADVLRDLDADLVALQEVDSLTLRSGGVDQAAELASAAGYAHHHFIAATPWPGGGEYGVALLSREPLHGVSGNPLPIDGPAAHPSATEPRVLASARLGTNITVLNTHFGLTDSQRRKQALAVAARAGTHVVLLGDLNATPDDPALNPIRQVMQDAFETVDPVERMTFPEPPGKIIDYVFIGTGLRVRSARVAVEAGGASDHYPLVVDLHYLGKS